MYDFNNNGKDDPFDSFVSYNLINDNNYNRSNNSDWWKILLLFILMSVCPILGIIAVIIIICK